MAYDIMFQVVQESDLIFLYYKIILKLSLVTICHLSKLLLNFLCCILHLPDTFCNWKFFPLNLQYLFYWLPTPTHFGNYQLLLWIYESLSVVCFFIYFVFRFCMEIKLYSSSLSSFDLFQLAMYSLGLFLLVEIIRY